MSIVVSDTSPIIALSHLRHLDWLERFFIQVLIPPAVAAELEKEAWKGVAHHALHAPFICVQAPTDRKHVDRFSASLDPGESEALALAIEVAAEAVLMDEAQGRAMAQQLGLTTIGVLGLLLRAKREGLLSSVKPELERLQRELGFHLSDHLRAQVLKDAGE